MEQPAAGDLVQLATGGPLIDGIVADAPAGGKVVVAVIDRVRGPVLRTVERTALTGRTAAGGDDDALRLLIRRTPATVRGGGRGGAGAVAGRVGHGRASMHRTTGK